MEKVFERDQCVNHAEKHGWYVRKVRAVGTTGFPDRLFIKEGVVIFIEFKDPGSGNTASKRQELEMRKLRRAGVEAYVCDNWNRFLEILNHGIPTETLGPGPVPG